MDVNASVNRHVNVVGARLRRQFKPLTPRQREVLAFIEDYVYSNSFPPTTRELSAACRLGGPSAAHRVLDALERKGYIHRARGRSRALTLSLPKSDFSVLQAEDLFLVCATYLSQSAIRDRCIRVSLRVEDLGVKAILLQEAVERHRVVAELHHGLARCEDEIDRTRRSLRTFLAHLNRDVDWPTFVVEHLVQNVGSRLGARVLSEQELFTEGPFPRLLTLSQRAVEQCEIWLGQILEGRESQAIARDLQRRARDMMTLGLQAVRMAEAKRRSLFAALTLEYAGLPEILVRAPRPRRSPRARASGR